MVPMKDRIVRLKKPEKAPSPKSGRWAVVLGREDAVMTMVRVLLVRLLLLLRQRRLLGLILLPAMGRSRGCGRLLVLVRLVKVKQPRELEP